MEINGNMMEIELSDKRQRVKEREKDRQDKTKLTGDLGQEDRFFLQPKNILYT